MLWFYHPHSYSIWFFLPKLSTCNLMLFLPCFCALGTKFPLPCTFLALRTFGSPSAIFFFFLLSHTYLHWILPRRNKKKKSNEKVSKMFIFLYICMYHAHIHTFYSMIFVYYITQCYICYYFHFIHCILKNLCLKRLS